MDRSAYFNIFFDCVAKVNPMTEFDKQLCYDHFEVKAFPKNTIIEIAGRIPQYQNFVVSGILRKFTVDAAGLDITTAINPTPCFFSSHTALMERKISEENLESITDCVLLRVKRDDVDYLFEQGKTIHQFTILLFQQIMEEQKQTAFDLVNLTAKERYLKFLNKYPHLMQQVPLQHIASLLGITPQSLSRIRKEITA